MAASFVASRAHGSLSMSSCAPSSSGTPEAGPSNRSSTWLGDGNAVLRSSATIGGKLNFGVGFCHASKSSSRSVVKAEATSLDEVEEPQQKFDVSSNCVTPSFRSGPWQGTDNERETSSSKANILFLSEGNVCRSIYAEAMFNRMLIDRDLADEVACTSKITQAAKDRDMGPQGCTEIVRSISSFKDSCGITVNATKDYNVGEPPDPRAVQIAEELGLQLREGATARLIDHAKDIVQYDLVLCFDKFNASDVLKEISVYDTIDSKGRYSVRVRRLGEFCRNRHIEELDDPLYGNMGGPDEFENLRQSARDIWDCCEGLADKLQEMKRDLPEGQTLQEAIAHSLAGMEAFDWLVPPMLQKREKATL